jgi:aldose 1-epimerase
MGIIKKKFGETAEGAIASIYTLSNNKGMTAKITDFGGTIVSLCVPDKDGKLEDVVLGYDTLESYLKQRFYHGAIIGRYANRIENATFEINGIVYPLGKNEGENHLHGGFKGFDKVLWQGEIITKDGTEALQLSYLSKDGEEGYPGNLEVKVTYTITNENALQIEYFAVSDKDTVVNLTNHAYFNLSGHDSGNILKHQVKILADQFTVSDQYSLPTGEIRSVKGTPMDFTEFTSVEAGIHSKDQQIQFGNGYDLNYVLKGCGKSPDLAASVYDASSGRLMEVYTTKPGIQFYSGNFLDGSEVGKGGAEYHKNSGLCLETQYFPNALKHKHFPSPILRAGQQYEHSTSYRFHL